MSRVPILEIYAATDNSVQLMGMLALTLLLAFVFYWLKASRRRRAEEQLTDDERKKLEAMLADGKYQVWVYRLSTRSYIYLNPDGSYGQPMNPTEFAKPYDRDDIEELRSEIFDIFENNRQQVKGTLRSAAANENDRRYYKVQITVVSRDAKDRPVLLLGVLHDITEDQRRQQNVSELLMRYHTVFNSSLVDMIYYDANGVLTDINERACQAFNVESRDYAIKGHFLLENNPFYNKIPLEQMQNTRTSSVVNFADYSEDKYKVEELGLRGRMYYESTINPIRDIHGQLQGVFMAGRDITEMVVSYHRQQESIRQLREATKNTEEYLRNINYALQVSNVRMVNYYPGRYTMEISNDAGKPAITLSQLRCIRLGTPRFRRVINSVLNRMDHLTKYNITQLVETELRDKRGRQIWLLFSLVPMLDEQGHVERYFGMCRDMTDMVETEQRLAVETKKAQETELLKQSFLANMSYEIRTPLNTVVGFAELFTADHDETDEPFFIDQIKRSTNKLLLLVNDVLFLSQLDAHMVEFKREPVDFTLLFSTRCQLGLSAVKPTVELSIDQSYNHLVLLIDENYVGMIIQRLCEISAEVTAQGAIRTRYEYHHGQLTFAIEDTGNGIPKDILSHVFDRFIHNEHSEMLGTGLDLPILQSLAIQMGGTIDIESDMGKGTTVWVTIPCEAQEMEKRRDANTANTTNPTEQLFL